MYHLLLHESYPDIKKKEEKQIKPNLCLKNIKQTCCKITI